MTNIHDKKLSAANGFGAYASALCCVIVGYLADNIDDDMTYPLICRSNIILIVESRLYLCVIFSRFNIATIHVNNVYLPS